MEIHTWYISLFSQFSMYCKLAEVALYPTVLVNSEDTKQYWTHYGTTIVTVLQLDFMLLIR